MGLRAGAAGIHAQDRTWATFSDDKVRIGESTNRVLRTVAASLSLRASIRALSVGSSSEPQFRLLEAWCDDGLYLLDVDHDALDVVRTRVERQRLEHVAALEADLTRALATPTAAARLRDRHLDGDRLNLVLFHHSLYYAPRARWDALIDATYTELLKPARGGRPTAAIHAVLKASRAGGPLSTTGLYDRFAGGFCGAVNDQDLAGFGRGLRRSTHFRTAQVAVRTGDVFFDTDDFEAFMGVVWMVLLYPQVHQYTQDQRVEITEWVYRHLWSQRRPLHQVNDYVAVYRGRLPGAWV